MSIETILRNHRRSRRLAANHCCICGWTPSGDMRPAEWEQNHEHHLADLIRAELTGDEAREVVARKMLAAYTQEYDNDFHWTEFADGARELLGALVGTVLGGES